MKRFWNRVDKSPGLGPDGDCWEWIGGKLGKGYGQSWHEGKKVLAHRHAWFLEHNEWPNLNICHRCDNPSCVRIDHLFEASQYENIQDKMKKGRQLRGEFIGNSKLTEDIVINEIIPSINRGESDRSIANRLGVTDGAILRIRHKRTWRHVQNE